MNSETCAYDWYGSSSLTPSQPYCSWICEYDVDGDEGCDWQCASDGFSVCQIYGTDDECMWYNQTELSYSTSCTVEIGGWSVNYIGCCSTDNCNHEDAEYSTEICTRNTEFEDIMEQYNACSLELYEDETYRSIYCGEPVESLSCGALKTAYTKEIDCVCDKYSALYDGLSSATQYQVQLLMDSYSISASRYNNILGCDIHIECNVETGVTANYDSSMKLDVLGISIFTFIGILMINN